MTSTVAVIGLGIMGGAIARNLVERGTSVSGYDVDAGAMQRPAMDVAMDVTVKCLPR